MSSTPSKSVALFALFLVGVVITLPLVGCSAPSDDAACGRANGATGASVGELDEDACDDEESAELAAPPQEKAASPSIPVAVPQSLCSPFCDRI